jgi:hypothetical protein
MSSNYGRPSSKSKTKRASAGARVRSIHARLYSKVWPMLSIFDSVKQKIAVGN